MRAELAVLVRARRTELERAIFARLLDCAFSSSSHDDAEYVAGLRAAVTAAVEYALVSIEYAGEQQVPPEAIAQAHRASRTGVSLATVLLRYAIGSSLLSDFLMQAAAEIGCGPHVMREALNVQAGALERLLARIMTEYESELERARRSPEERRAERVMRLLAGNPGDLGDLGYELSGWHVGVIATGTAARETLRTMAGGLESRLLSVPRGEQTVWGWFGSRCKPLIEDIELLLRSEESRAGDRDGAGVDRSTGCAPMDVSLAVGEPASGLDGWRATHRQAQAALQVALLAPRRLARYADVALIAPILRENDAASFLVDIYLTPLGGSENGGAVLRETLRAYFAAERNASSAARALGVTRNTVENRLRTIEQKLGRAVRTRQAELEVALRLEELGKKTSPVAQWI